ncbi:hypothetical protein [Nocardia thailandica]
MSTSDHRAARHRLGLPGGVHCLEIPVVAAIFSERRRSWFAAWFTPARHAAGARPAVSAPAPQWVPVTAS